MQAFNTEWLAYEHQRLHKVEQWLDSPRKQALLGAIRSTLARLSRHPNGLRHTDCTLTRVLRARFTFSRMSEADAVQIKGLGRSL